MTEEARKKAILDARETAKSEENPETHALTIRGERRVLPVISLRISVPVLNPHSHRIRAQLLEDPDYVVVQDDPFSDAAQNVLTRLVQDRHRQFAELKASLRTEGQRDPGVITHSGLLVNANTRLVALRDLAMPDRQSIKAMLLPPDISSSAQDVLEIETSLQVQRELKDPYSLINELLLIEELARGDEKIGRSNEQIAVLMRYEGANSDSARKRLLAAKQVEESLRLLRMIRHLASLTNPKLPLTIFDAGESSRERRQPLSEFARRYDDFLQTDGLHVADAYAREWLIAFLGEAGAVHKARVITPGWVDDFVLEELREDDRFSDHAEALIAAIETSGIQHPTTPEGLDLLDDPGEREDSSIAPVLLNMLAAAKIGSDPVKIPGGCDIDAAEFRSVMTSAALGAIRAKERLDRDERATYAPIDHLNNARASLRKAAEAYERVRRTADFNRNKFLLILKRLRRDIELLEVRGKADASGDTTS